MKLFFKNINVQIEKREYPENPCQQLKLIRANEPRKNVCHYKAVISSLSSTHCALGEKDKLLEMSAMRNRYGI